MEQLATEPLPPFATAEQLERFTRGKLREDDLRTHDAVAAVSRSIRREAYWHIWPIVTQHELVLDGPGGPVLAVPTMKLRAVHSITDAGNVLATADDVDAAVDWSAAGLISKVGGGTWTRRYRQIRVTIDHGHDEVEDLQQLTLQLAARALSSPMGATREQAGSLSVNWGMAVQGVSGGLIPLAPEQAVMERYRWTGH